MNRLFLLLLLCAPLWAVPPVLPAEIPSAASGRYSTPAGECSVVFSRFGSDQVNVDIACPGTYSHSTAFAPGSACPGSPGVAYVFPISGPNPAAGWLAFDALDGANLIVRRGVTSLLLYAGSGTAEYWTRIEALQSPQPYTCGPPPINRRALAGFCRRNPTAALCEG